MKICFGCLLNPWLYQSAKHLWNHTCMHFFFSLYEHVNTWGVHNTPSSYLRNLFPCVEEMAKRAIQYRTGRNLTERHTTNGPAMSLFEAKIAWKHALYLIFLVSKIYLNVVHFANVLPQVSKTRPKKSRGNRLKIRQVSAPQPPPPVRLTLALESTLVVVSGAIVRVCSSGRHCHVNTVVLYSTSSAVIPEPPAETPCTVF